MLQESKTKWELKNSVFFFPNENPLHLKRVQIFLNCSNCRFYEAALESAQRQTPVLLAARCLTLLFPCYSLSCSLLNNKTALLPRFSTVMQNSSVFSKLQNVFISFVLCFSSLIEAVRGNNVVSCLLLL